MNTQIVRHITNVFKTSDDAWHLQVYRSISLNLPNGPSVEVDSQVIRLFTVSRLIEALELASTLQLHVDNISELPVSQYALQSVA